MTPMKDYLPDARGLMHIWTYRDCAELIKICTGSNQTGSRHWEEEMDTGFNEEAICACCLVDRENFQLSPVSVTGYINQTPGQASRPGVTGQHRTNSMLSPPPHPAGFCFILIFFLSYWSFLVCFDFCSCGDFFFFLRGERETKLGG